MLVRWYKYQLRERHSRFIIISLITQRDIALAIFFKQFIM